jgi:hypothetical protein
MAHQADALMDAPGAATQPTPVLPRYWKRAALVAEQLQHQCNDFRIPFYIALFYRLKFCHNQMEIYPRLQGYSGIRMVAARKQKKKKKMR